MDLVQKNLLEQVAGLHEVPEGAYNIRANGKKAARNTTANIDIVTKEDKDGIDIIIKPGTVNESVHIPVVLSESGLQECVSVSYTHLDVYKRQRYGNEKAFDSSPDSRNDVDTDGRLWE